MTDECLADEARKVLQWKGPIYQLFGRCIVVDFARDEIDVSEYIKWNGDGLAEHVIQQLRTQTI